MKTNRLCVELPQTPLMGRRYFQDLPSFMQDNVAPGRLPIAYEAAIISSLLCGAVVGNILGGSLADVYGRKFLFEVACGILTVIAFMSAYSFGTSGPAVIGSLAFWRFFLGIGIGAMYPLSAIIMSEYSTRKSRGAYISFVFAMQGKHRIHSELHTVSQLKNSLHITSNFQVEAYYSPEQLLPLQTAGLGC